LHSPFLSPPVLLLLLPLLSLQPQVLPLPPLPLPILLPPLPHGLFLLLPPLLLLPFAFSTSVAVELEMEVGIVQLKRRGRKEETQAGKVGRLLAWTEVQGTEETWRRILRPLVRSAVQSHIKSKL
jgi:hypothetical protein